MGHSVEVRPGYRIETIKLFVEDDVNSLFTWLLKRCPRAGNLCGGLHKDPQYQEFIDGLRKQLLDELLELSKKENPWEELESIRQRYL